MMSTLLIAIAEHMSFKAICVASTVCRHWRNVLGTLPCKEKLILRLEPDSTNKHILIEFIKAHKTQFENVVCGKTRRPKMDDDYNEIISYLYHVPSLVTLMLFGYTLANE